MDVLSDTDEKQLTVIVVSDFEPGEKTWKDEIAMAKAMAAQDTEADFDLVFVENAAPHTSPPPKAIEEAFPGAKILFHASEKSAALKDFGVQQSDTPWVALLEADALPEPSWLSHLLKAASNNPEYDIISGRTYYGDQSSWQRALNLLDRSFDDKSHSGPGDHISNNGALYKTEMLKKFPYPETESPFVSARRRNFKIMRAGHKVYFERAALMRHAIGGFDFVMDFRRHTGFSDMMLDPPQRFWKIPGKVAWRSVFEMSKIIRLNHAYWRWYDWPLGIGLWIFARIPETLGMVDAVRKKEKFENTSYR